MNFHDIPTKYQPAYTWLWNTTITREGIKERIDEMYASGIRAFYVIGEPENFRPQTRRTHLFPEYLSEDYIELLFYAFITAREKGMYMWLYNEGGFPSGMVCGKICKEHPKLAQKIISSRKITVRNEQQYTPCTNMISAFANEKRVYSGTILQKGTELTEYFWQDNKAKAIQSDNASRKNVEYFLEMTHEKLKKRFGDYMGTDIVLMFDDESFMGSWTEGFEKIFFAKYGYEIEDFIPYISGDKSPESESQYQAKSDYIMLCGDLVRENYFTPMKDWLHRHGMLSTGHLDNDHLANGNVLNRYGNVMKTLREFDVPGIDVIRNQIYYPNKFNEFDGMNFFPRFASSAAHQLGHADCLSESFAVYGAHTDQELMRFGVNYQAVRGISLFNFMVMSYDKKTPMLHQYRPNYVKENPSMDRLSEINTHTARLSYILSNTKPDVKTALYYPARSIAAGGKLGELAAERFTKLGNELETKGVSFDIIDEDLVLQGKNENGTLDCGTVKYDNVFLSECNFELPDVIEKIKQTNSSVKPDIIRKNEYILSRKLIFDNGDEGYLIVNTGCDTVNERIIIPTSKKLYQLDLNEAKLYYAEYDHFTDENAAILNISLFRGEAIFIIASNEQKNAIEPKKEKYIASIDSFTSYVSRKMLIDTELGTVNEFYKEGNTRDGLYEWDADFSGEVTYTAEIPPLSDGKYILDLGKVSSTAVVYLDGKKIKECTYPPYYVEFDGKIQGRDLKIVVANTAANECARTDYFTKMDIRDVGAYHEKMSIYESREGGGGLFGPVIIKKLCNN